MIRCRKCGAENSSGGKFCQMCASVLPGDDASGNEGATQIANSSLSTTVAFSTESFPDAQICPVCDAANEGAWVFCQQCGSNLKQAPVESSDTGDIETPRRQRAYATTIKASELVDKLKKAAGNPPAKPAQPFPSAQPAQSACPKCSQPVVNGAAFCHKCGAAIASGKTVAMSSVKPARKARLLLIVDGEATGDEFEIKGDTVIGRVNGDITFPHDDYMSGRHGRIIKRGDKFVLIDEDSRNGSFIRIKKEVEIKPGDSILLGKQLFRFEV